VTGKYLQTIDLL